MKQEEVDIEQKRMTARVIPTIYEDGVMNILTVGLWIVGGV